MVTLKLNAEEADLLGQVLKNYLATLEVELCHTDHSEFRLLLKNRRAQLSVIAERLESALTPVAA